MNEEKKSYSSVLVDNEMMIGEIMPWLYCQHNVSEGNGMERVHFEILISNPDHQKEQKSPKEEEIVWVYYYFYIFSRE